VANIPVLLTPADNGTISKDAPYFELYATAANISTEIQFEVTITGITDPNKTAIITIGDAGWSKATYVSGEIALLNLTSLVTDLWLPGEMYSWKAQSFDGVNWSADSVIKYFNVLSYVGDSDVGVFTVAEDALDAMKPQLLSIDSPLIENVPPYDEQTPIITSRVPTMTWSVPYGLGDGIHFRVEIDIVDTFDTRYLMRYDSKYRPDLFRMSDGLRVLAFPETGTTYGVLTAQLFVPDTMFNDTYYWRVIPAI